MDEPHKRDFLGKLIEERDFSKVKVKVEKTHSLMPL